MPRLWPHREQAPALWRVFCQDWLLLSRTKTEAWWSALQAARGGGVLGQCPGAALLERPGGL